MSQLGDMLEVLYGPRASFNTVTATIRQWCDRDLAEQATDGNRTVMGRRKAITISAVHCI